MNNLNFVTTRERAEALAKELGEYITVERYDDECDRVTFTEPMSSLQLLLIMHAGIKYGHESLARAFGINSHV